MWSWGSNPREPEASAAAEDADEAADRSIRLVEAATGTSWYTAPGNDADAAVAALCRLRRVQAGRRRSGEGGDEAVRAVLEQATPEAVIWLASRAISYMDEQGFPEDVEPWLTQR